MGATGAEWVPLSVRESDDSDGFESPLEEIPDWLFISLWDYVEVALHEVDPGKLYLEVRELERRLRRNLEMPRGVPGAIVDVLHKRMQNDGALCLDVLDYLLRFAIDSTWALPIAAAFREAGFVWTVTETEDGAFLSRRVGDGAQVRAQKAMEVGDRCSKHLAEAWHCVFGRNPDGQKGYDEVVKAVECAVQPVVSPQNPKTTLGTAVADMRAKPSKWEIGLSHPDSERQVVAVVEMMDVLWKGQHRHGVTDIGAPMGNTDEEAEGAMQIGITLVEWFRSEFIRRVT